MDVDFEMMDMSALASEYQRIADALAAEQARTTALTRELADVQQKVTTLRRQVQAMEFAETTVSAPDPVKAAMVGYLSQHRARLVTQMSVELRDFIWMDEVVSAGVRAVLNDDAPDEQFETQCIEIEKRLHWVALVSVVMDGDVVFRALSNTVSFSEE